MRRTRIRDRETRWDDRPRSFGLACSALLLWTVVALLVCGVDGLAGPAAPAVFTLEQPNGTTFQAHTVGDEWRHWTETIDGYTVLQDGTTGTWVYAVAGPNGALVAGSQPAGEGVPPAVDRHLRPISSEEGPPIGAPGTQPPGVSYAPPVSGTHKALILVVDFTPSTLVAASIAASATYWNSRFFGASNSVDDYLDEVSYGQLRLSPATESQGTANDGVVYVQLGYTHPNTGGSTGNTNRQMVQDAINAADSSVLYSSFDTNADGYLSTDELHVVTIVAGYETSYGGTATACTPNVWAHQWSLSSSYQSVVIAAPLVDSVYVGHWWGGASGTMGGYTQLGEWHCATWDNPGHAGTIGQIAHELGHDLGSGLPDLYDTDGSSEGIGEWCLQASGAWNSTSQLGDKPAHWSAWAKWYLGLLTPTQITTNTNNTSFPRVEDATGANHGVYHVLSNPSGVDWDWASPGSGEYFLLENRQQIGYDSAIPGTGLCIWHIYEPAPGDNTANADEGTSAPGDDATYPRLVAMEQRDGNFDLEGYGVSPPGGVNRGDTTDPWVSPSQFHNASTPNSKLYSGSSTWVSVIDISASSATMTADVQLTQPPAATAAVFRVESGGDVLMDQTLYSVALAPGSADVAEWVNVSEPVEPGDVLELDPTNSGQYRKARGPCSSLIAGVVSTEPGVVLGSSFTDHSSPITGSPSPTADNSSLITHHSEALLALIGIVPTRVTDEGGPILSGDLLVASSTPGYAMRWSGSDPCALVGKALEPMIGSEGVILVLLTAH